jgi:hypothetical protein
MLRHPAVPIRRATRGARHVIGFTSAALSHERQLIFGICSISGHERA